MMIWQLHDHPPHHHDDHGWQLQWIIRGDRRLVHNAALIYKSRLPTRLPWLYDDDDDDNGDDDNDNDNDNDDDDDDDDDEKNMIILGKRTKG